MPDVPSRETGESNSDSRHHAGIGAHRILPTSLTRLRKHDWPRVFDLTRGPVGIPVEGSTVQNLESDQVQVNWMNIIARIYEIPNLH